MPALKTDMFWQDMQNPSYAVVYYVELLKFTLDLIKRGYENNIFRIKKCINTLYLLAIDSRLEDLSTNALFKAQQSTLKKLANEAQTEKTPDIVNKAYLVRVLNTSIDINDDSKINPTNLSFLRVICNLPLVTESISADYYAHLAIYRQNTCEHDVQDTGELVFTLSQLIENYDEGDFDEFFKVRRCQAGNIRFVQHCS